MLIRNTQSNLYRQVLNGLNTSSFRLARAQEQIASGKRILRPSDDSIGAALTLSIRRQLNDVQRMLGSIDVGRGLLEASTAALENAGAHLTETREVVVQGLNGTLNDGDRRVLAGRVEEIRNHLLGLANSSFQGTYLFGGTRTDAPPFGETPVAYGGDRGVRRVTVGFGVDLATNVPGDELFAKREPRGVTLTGVTGAALGTTANQGRGFAELEVRHDATTGALGAGLALVDGGARDSFLGTRTLVVDATARTVQLGDGPVTELPPAGDPALADLVVRDEHGAELHLDASGFTDVDFSGTLTGAGSISLDGTTWTPLALTETDLELIDPVTNDVLHVDTTGIRRAGTELVTFGGATSVFDVLDAIRLDLENPDGLPSEEVLERLAARLDELDRHHANVLGGLGTLGARLERLDDSADRLVQVNLHLESRRSEIEDADISAVALELSKADQTLQLAQATGARLIQNTLLNYLG